MSNYGRNFEFRIAPDSKDRSGRNFLDNDAATPNIVAIGAPVVYGDTGEVGDSNGLGLRPVVLAAADADAPLPGQGGIAVYEHGPNAFAGDDPWLTTYSDKGYIPQGAAVQVVTGRYVKVVLRNTDAFTFNSVRPYAARNMILASDAATLAVGDGLTPGAGNDTSGYWKAAGDAASTWLVVESVRTSGIHGTTGVEVEARLNF